MKKTTSKSLFNIVWIIAVYFVLFYGLIQVYSRFVYPTSGWFEDNPIAFIVFNDIIQMPLLFFILLKVRKVHIFKEAGFTKLGMPQVVTIVSIGLLMGWFTDLFFSLSWIQEQFPQFEEILAYLNDGSSVLMFLAFLLYGNIYKEMLFRGMIFKELRNLSPLMVAILIQGILYGGLFFSFDIPLTVYGFLGAVVFALLYVRYRSIWAPIVAQYACQGSQYVFRRSETHVTDPNMQYLFLTITGIAIVALLIVIFNKHRGLQAHAIRKEGAA